MLDKEIAITGSETKPALRGQIPGAEAKALVEQDGALLANTTKTSPIGARAAKGCVVLTVDGDVMLDFAAGVGVANTGHCHPSVVEAIQRQAARLIHFAGTDFYYESQTRLAEKLLPLVPGATQKKIFYTNSGTESVEAAMKIAAWSTQRRRFIAFQKAFHGRTLGALGLTNSKPVHRRRFPSIAGTHHVPFPAAYRNAWGIDGYDDPKTLSSAALGFVESLLETAAPADEVAAFFAEPIQGEGGYNVPPDDFYPQLHALLRKHGILLVADEVQTGFGRTGQLFAMQHYNVNAEITTLAKGMGSGMPIGAAVFDAALDFGVQGAHSNTYGGNPVACAAAEATLDVIQSEKLVENAARVGQHFRTRLDEVKQSNDGIGDVRGRGLMLVAEWVKDRQTKEPDANTRDAVLRAAYQRGLILLPCGTSGIRFIPPLVVTQDQVDGAVDVLIQAITATK